MIASFVAHQNPTIAHIIQDCYFIYKNPKCSCAKIGNNKVQ